MKRIVILFILISINSFSQKKKQHSEKDFTDKIIEFAIENQEDKFIELPDLYDKTTTEIPTDENEKILLGEKLKTKGFKQIDLGRGNYPPLGPKIIEAIYKKADCECTVAKIYYYTINETEYMITEKIKCKKINL